MHQDDREILKESVTRAIMSSGSSNKSKRRFKKLTARALARTSPLVGNALRLQVDSMNELIDELWTEVRNESV